MLQPRPQVLVAASDARTTALLDVLRAEPIDVHVPASGSEAIAFLREGRRLDVVLAAPRFGNVGCDVLMRTALDAHVQPAPAWILLATDERSQGLRPDVLRQFSVSFPWDAEAATIATCVRTVLGGRLRARERPPATGAPAPLSFERFGVGGSIWGKAGTARAKERASLEEMKRTTDTRVAILSANASGRRVLSTILEAAGMTAHGYGSCAAVESHAAATPFGAIVIEETRGAGEAARAADELAGHLAGRCPPLLAIGESPPAAPARASFVASLARSAPSDELIVAVRSAIAQRSVR